MKLGKITGMTALAFALAIPFQAAAAPFAPVADLERLETATVHAIGYRSEKHRRFNGGISYVGEYGLKYAPSYRHRRHHDVDVTVNIYAEPPQREEYGNRTRPLIIELPE